MIRFSKYIWVYFVISGIVLLAGIISLLRWGLSPAIDFTGGTLIELHFTKPTSAQIINQKAQASSITISSIQKSADGTYLVRMKPALEANLLLFKSYMATPAGSLETLREETVGPILGRELLSKAVFGSLLAIGAILAYVAYAFRNVRFGVAAIIALAHDLLIVLGSFSILGHYLNVEVDTLFVTAFLTTMSFSVHDTIVVFDRIREYKKTHDKMPFDHLCDQALTETMGRSLTNSLTVILMLLALVLMGGISVRWFVVALLIGTTSGAYSSPFIATPVLILWDKWTKRNKFKSKI